MRGVCRYGTGDAGGMEVGAVRGLWLICRRLKDGRPLGGSSALALHNFRILSIEGTFRAHCAKDDVPP
jgi:hypothetical protein